MQAIVDNFNGDITRNCQDKTNIFNGYFNNLK